MAAARAPVFGARVDYPVIVIPNLRLSLVHSPIKVPVCLQSLTVVFELPPSNSPDLESNFIPRVTTALLHGGSQRIEDQLYVVLGDDQIVTTD